MNPIEDFEKQFDDMVSVLRKLNTMAEEGKLAFYDVNFINECKIILDNYDLIKSTFNPDLIKVVGNQIFSLVKEFVETLHTDLLHIYRNNNGNPELDKIEELDTLLKNTDITAESIDTILDKRIALMELINNR